MEKKEIIQKLKDSLEVSIHRQSLALVLIVTASALGIYTFFHIEDFRNVELWKMLSIITGIVILPIYAVEGWALWKIFRKAGSYRFYRTTLGALHSCKWTRFMYFTVVLQDPDGARIVNTNPIFSTRNGGALIEDYVNQTVTVAYNEETGEVVVIG